MSDKDNAINKEKVIYKKNKEWKKINEDYLKKWWNSKTSFKDIFFLRDKWEKSIWQYLYLFLRDFVIFFTIALIIQTYAVAIYRVSGSSMEWNLHNWDYLFVNKFSNIWLDEDPKRGDMIVFEAPIDIEYHFIKRVIWVPWDVIKIVWWYVYVKENWSNEFKLLDEPYLSEENLWNTYSYSNLWFWIYEVPEWKYFVMWDNRLHSTDSRSCFHSCIIKWSSPFLDKNSVKWTVVPSFIDYPYYEYSNIN